MNKKQKRGFLLAFALIACISVLEVITIVVDGAPTGCRWLNILSNYLGFGLTPAVALCLVYVLDKNPLSGAGSRQRSAARVRICFFWRQHCPMAGILGEQGEPLRPGRILLYLCGDVLCRHVVPYGGYGAHGSGFSEPQPHADLPADPVSGGGDRDPDRAAIAARHMAVRHLLSVLYYIYCSEMWNQLDALTGLLNQNSYLNRTAEMRRSGGVLVVFDVDSFKQINDRYGHLQGDVCLAEIADCIKKAYAAAGTVTVSAAMSSACC